MKEAMGKQVVGFPDCKVCMRENQDIVEKCVQQNNIHNLTDIKKKEVIRGCRWRECIKVRFTPKVDPTKEPAIQDDYQQLLQKQLRCTS